MAGQILHSIIWRLVRLQHGAVARRQLLEVGLSRHAIDQRIENGRLHPVFRGVYAVGRPQLSQEGWWTAAVLACGPQAALSDGSGGALWGVVPVRRGPIEVTVPRRATRKRNGIVVHRRALSDDEITRHRGVPVIAVVPTLIDLATQLGRDSLEAAISEADKRDLVDPERLRDELEAYRGRPGVAILRKTLDRHTFRPTDSWLERRFLPIARRAGLPMPETRKYEGGARLDFYWPELRLIVETDGLRYHRTPAQQVRDRLRDQKHLAQGLTPLRFTHAQIRYEPAHVQAILEAVHARIAA
jgi:very-short-patch-repair endonuclease